MAMILKNTLFYFPAPEIKDLKMLYTNTLYRN